MNRKKGIELRKQIKLLVERNSKLNSVESLDNVLNGTINLFVSKIEELERIIQELEENK